MKRFLQVLALIFFGFIGLIRSIFLLMLLLEFFANLVLSHRVGINGALMDDCWYYMFSNWRRWCMVCIIYGQMSGM